jgi:hypothetical protein
MALPINSDPLRGIKAPPMNPGEIFRNDLLTQHREAFCRWVIRLEDRRVLDVSGNQSLDIQPQVGATIVHWAAPARAKAWWEYANALLSDTTRIQQLNAGGWALINTTDKDANRSHATLQFQYVTNIVRAIADGYNCLNLVWHNDPIARSLYRKWISGPPKQNVGVTSRSVFGEAEDYNSAWYSKNALLPKLASDSGILQQKAMPDHGKAGRVGDFFDISAMLVLARQSPLVPNVPVEYAPAVYNAAMVRSGVRQNCPAEVGFPWTQQCEAGKQEKGLRSSNADVADSIVGGFQFHAFLPDGTELPEGFDDWRASYRITGAFSANPVATAPLFDYLAYLREWVQLLLTRSPWQTIQDTRQFVIYENLQTLGVNGGDAALAKIAGSSADILRQQKTSDTGLTAVATAVALAGAAVGTVTSGVGALVGGAISSVILLADAASTHTVEGHGRDDLGRYKLLLERGWLSGTPESIDRDSGQPVLPADLDGGKRSSILEPPGHWGDQDCPAPGEIRGGPGDPDNPPKKGISTTVAWALGAAALLLGAVLVMQPSETTTPPKVAKAPKTPKTKGKARG